MTALSPRSRKCALFAVNGIFTFRIIRQAKAVANLTRVIPLCISYLNCYYVSSLFVFHFLYHSVGAPTKLTNALEVVGLDLELFSINCDVSSWLLVALLESVYVGLRVRFVRIVCVCVLCADVIVIV